MSMSNYTALQATRAYRSKPRGGYPKHEGCQASQPDIIRIRRTIVDSEVQGEVKVIARRVR